MEPQAELQAELNKWRSKAMMRQNLIEYVKTAINHEKQNVLEDSPEYEMLTRIEKAAEL